MGLIDSIGKFLGGPIGTFLGGPLVGAVAGSILQSGAQRRANKSQIHEADPATIRAKYEAAKVNPLLGFQGGYQVPQINAPQIGNTISSGFAAAADINQREKELEYQAQVLDQQNQELTRRLNAATIGPRVASMSSTSILSGAKNASAIVDNRDPLPAGPPLRIAGELVEPHSGYSDAEETERRYGDVVSSAYGITVLGADFGRWLRKKAASRELDDRIKRNNRDFLAPLFEYGQDARYDVWRAQHNSTYNPAHWR